MYNPFSLIIIETYTRAQMRMIKELINDRIFLPVNGMWAQKIKTTVKIPKKKMEETSESDSNKNLVN